MKKLLCIAISMLCIAIATVIPTESSTTVAETTTATETTTIIETTTELIETTTESPRNMMTVTATAYCSCVKCCGKYALNRPKDENGKDIIYTASGEIAKQGRTIAADTSILPFGTTVIFGGKEYVVQDTGSTVKGKKIDIYFDCHEEALKWGRQQIEIEVLL
jgi:3D (Asp-Asp-Asp) domain-containing protein